MDTQHSRGLLIAAYVDATPEVAREVERRRAARAVAP